MNFTSGLFYKVNGDYTLFLFLNHLFIKNSRLFSLYLMADFLLAFMRLRTVFVCRRLWYFLTAFLSALSLRRFSAAAKRSSFRIFRSLFNDFSLGPVLFSCACISDKIRQERMRSAICLRRIGFSVLNDFHAETF